MSGKKYRWTILIIFVLSFVICSCSNKAENSMVNSDNPSVTPVTSEIGNDTEIIESEEDTTVSETTVETSPEPDTVEQMEPIIWYEDLTHDGIDEKIVVDLTYVINYPVTGEEQTVSIYSGSSEELIWTGHADIVHPGWNGIYLYNDGKNDYLLLWKPTVYQDSADFSLHIFALSDDGKEIDLVSEGIQFGIYNPKDSSSEEISAFIDMVNGYLEKSYVFVDTDNGEPVYSTTENKTVKLYDVSSILNEVEKRED